MKRRTWTEADAPPEIRAQLARIVAAEADVSASSQASSGLDPRGKLSLWTLMTPYSRHVAIAVASLAVLSVLQNVGPVLIAAAVDQGLVVGDYSQVLRFAALYVLALAATVLLSRFTMSYCGRLGQRAMTALRVHVFDHVQKLSHDYFTKQHAGRLMAAMTTHIDAVSGLLQDGLVNIAVQALTVAVMIGAMVYLNGQLAAILLILILPLLGLATWWFRRASAKAFGRSRDSVSDLTAQLRESLAGIRLIAAHDRHATSIATFSEALGRYRSTSITANKTIAAYTNGSEFIGVAGQSATLAIGALMIRGQSLQVGELIAFVLLISRFFAPLQMLLGSFGNYQAARAALAKVSEVLDETPAIQECATPRTVESAHGDLKLEEVSFAYGTDAPILTNVNLHVRSGETLALVGLSGAGKSTLAKLLVRFHDPTSGRILLDGQDLRTLTLQSLRRHILLIPQEPFLFRATIRENVAFAHRDASSEEVERACEAAGLNRIAVKLPQGLDSQCFASGSALSSGEKQLIALARAFLIEPAVLILDEATSHVDPQTEAMVEDALSRLFGHRTCIVIAHRRSTFMRADRIAIIDDKTVRRIGTHADLLVEHGSHADVVEAWLRSSYDVSA